MAWDPATGSLDFKTLRALYRSGEATPADVVEAVYERIVSRDDDPAWTALVPRDAALAAARALTPDEIDAKPLYGIPFGIKENFDLQGFETTNACAASARMAHRNGVIVQRLIDAGAIAIGKNNMDQFGVGLNGTRTDYGIPRCVFNADYISGGSTSGGGVVVAAGMASFALGGDAAGSGRVPAALNNVVGLKATPGLIPNWAPMPAGMPMSNSAITLTVADAVTVARTLVTYDPTDPRSKPAAETYDITPPPLPAAFRFAVPDAGSLVFHGDPEAERLFAEAVAQFEALGGERVEVDCTPYLKAAKLLYEGPFIAQRTANMEAFFRANADKMFPATREIVSWGLNYSAMDAFRAVQAIEGVKQTARALFRDVEFLLTPTTPTTFTVEEMLADNIALNAVLGTYTNFVNLLDLPALAVPAGFRADGLALGVMLIGPSLSDNRIAGHGARYHAATGLPLGATGTLVDTL